MKDRQVSEEETVSTIENPDFCEPSVKGRINAFKFINGRYLRVTFREEVNQILVITVTIRLERSLLEGNVMKIEYSKSVDALYIRLREAKITDSMDIEEGVTVDIDEKGHIVGLEILDASEKLDISNLVNISIENLPLEKVT